MGTNDATTATVLPSLPVAARRQGVPAPGPGTALADVRPRLTPPDRGGSSSAADVLSQTGMRWLFTVRNFAGSVGSVPIPRGTWLRCGFCRSKFVTLRAWQFHTRPGKPTVPYRCDVHVKCSSCAAGWWHGVAVSEADWNARPHPSGIRSLLMRGNREPKLWAGVR